MIPRKMSPAAPNVIAIPCGLCSLIPVSGEVPITAAKAAPSRAAIHLAESRRRFPTVLQYSWTPASGAPDAAISSFDRAGHVGQMTLSISPFWPHWAQSFSSRRT